MACSEFEARVVLISVDDESPRSICRARGHPMPCNQESSEWGACLKGMLQHRIEVRDGEDDARPNAVGRRTCSVQTNVPVCVSGMQHLALCAQTATAAHRPVGRSPHRDFPSRSQLMRFGLACGSFRLNPSSIMLRCMLEGNKKTFVNTVWWKHSQYTSGIDEPMANVI